MTSALRHDEGRTRDLCRQAPAYAEYAGREAAHMLELVRAKLRAHVDSQAVQEVARIEASGMPGAH